MKQRFVFAVAMLSVLLAGFSVQQQVAYAAVDSFTVDTAKDAVDANIGDGICATAANQCSLRAAIQEANADPDETIIYLAAKTYKLKLAGTGEDAAASGDLDITSTVIIEGVSQKSTLIDARFIDRAFDVRENADLTLVNLSITNGFSTEQGGAVAVEALNSSLSIEAVTITNSRSEVAGGAVSIALLPSFSILGSTFTGNTAPIGGAIYLYDAEGLVQFNVLRDNNAVRGGAVAVVEGTLNSNANLYDANSANCSVWTLNCSEPSGGGLYIQQSSVLVMSSEMKANTTSGYGGAIGNLLGSVQTINSSISANQAKISGGGIYAYQGTVTVITSSITTNKSKGLGGGITVEDGTTTTFLSSTISGNTAKLDGGGIYLATPTEARAAEPHTFVFTTIAYNKAKGSGGGIVNNSGADAAVTNSIVSNNTAPASPNCGGTLTVNYSLLENTTGCTVVGDTGNLSGSANLLPLSYGIQGETLAHYPAVGSPAIAAIADCDTGGSDQLTSYRPETNCTMGSIEPTDRNLLINESFESGVSGWMVTSVDGLDKVVNKNPFSGSRAFVFTGKAGKTSLFKQVVKGAAVSNIGQNDDLCASGMFYTTNALGKNLTIGLIVKYTDKVKEKVRQSVYLMDGSYELNCSHIITVDLLGGTRSVKSAQLRVTSTSVSGKVFVDGLSLTHYPPWIIRDGGSATRDGSVLPPPSAPDGFRGNN